MDDIRYNRLEDKIDKLDGRLDSVDKQLAIYNLQLQQHIEGVKLAREQNDQLKNYVEKKFIPLDQHVETAKKNRALMNKIMYYLGWIIGIGAGLVEIFKK